MTAVGTGEPPVSLERAAWLATMAFIGALQVSIFAAQLLLAVTGVLWLVLVVRNRESIEVPRMFWPLALYAAWTLVSATFAVDRMQSILDTKQLLLFLIIPIAYRLLPGRLSLVAVDVVISVGAVSAMLGIVQYVIQGYDNLGRRPQGMLGLNMTYSGLVMLVVCAAFARIMFATHNRVWAALVMPALLIALAFTFTRSAWIGACCGVALLFVLRDFRLLALLPVAVGLFIALAPPNLSARIYSTFSLTDPSNADRVAMLKSGVRIIKDYPLTGVGPNMIIEVYPKYRDAAAVNALNPHLHNVPLQIAAERGLPALLAWLWFIVALVRELIKRRRGGFPSLVNGALAAVVAMLAAGMFEHNFGDSEFLMMFLVLVTLPFAAERMPNRAAAPAADVRHAG
jgi:putative inorganic carbon (hco3(-)) transporter